MIVDYATTESFRDGQRLIGPAALEAADFTAKLQLSDLPAGREIFYRISFESLADPGIVSAPIEGRFKTAPAEARSIRFVWSGDTCGQGWGINPDWGGLKGYAAMQRAEPDFFIHSGDTIYADQPFEAEVPLEDGSVWRNLVTAETSKVAETLDEFRGNYKYNLLDETLRRFNENMPVYVQWDDHETVNNWYPGEQLADDERYSVKSASLLAARANRAFHEFFPIRTPLMESERIHRVIHYGPLLDLFFLDMRSFRGPNTKNRQSASGDEAALLGARQLAWFKEALRSSTATWKVIAAGMPMSAIVGDGPEAYEAIANGDNGRPLGRELEIADLLSFIKRQEIHNLVWLAADVHYTAAHHYDPNRAAFQDFLPFWEFISGPIHSGTFGPNEMDSTFGPEVVFSKSAEDRKNLPPSDELQFFGIVEIDGESAAMTVILKDIADQELYRVTLPAAHIPTKNP